VIPYAKLPANLLSLPLVLSRDKKRFHLCNMFYPTTRYISIVVIRFAQPPKKRFRSFFSANNKDFVLLFVVPREQKRFYCCTMFCPTKENGFNAFAHFVQRTTMLFTESTVLLILITQRLMSHCRIQSHYQRPAVLLFVISSL